MKSELFPVAQSKDSVRNTAFAFVSTGSEGNTMKCSAAIETLVRYSKNIIMIIVIVHKYHIHR